MPADKRVLGRSAVQWTEVGEGLVCPLARLSYDLSRSWGAFSCAPAEQKRNLFFFSVATQPRRNAQVPKRIEEGSYGMLGSGRGRGRGSAMGKQEEGEGTWDREILGKGDLG